MPAPHPNPEIERLILGTTEALEALIQARRAQVGRELVETLLASRPTQKRRGRPPGSKTRPKAPPPE